MSFDELIIPARVLANAEAASRKGAIEVLCKLLSKNREALTSTEAMRALTARERLGGTGIGNGVAVPHGRADGIEEPVGALIRLGAPVDYDADDGLPVDLFCAVIVPARCSHEQAELVSKATTRLIDPEVRRCMRAARGSKELHACLIGKPENLGAFNAGARA